MQLTTIEQDILSNVRILPLNEQQLLLTSLKEKVQKKSAENNLEKKESAFLIAFKKFLKENQEDPLDIDTSIFDRDRSSVKEREIEL
jgi:hypothetical protein